MNAKYQTEPFSLNPSLTTMHSGLTKSLILQQQNPQTKLNNVQDIFQGMSISSLKKTRESHKTNIPSGTTQDNLSKVSQSSSIPQSE